MNSLAGSIETPQADDIAGANALYAGSLPPAPATPVSASPSAVLRGASASVTITGSSTNGSGFFDTGLGNQYRLSASVNGGGVTINSLTLNSATSVTLDLTIASNATVGNRTVTITNPNGLSATSASGIFTILGLPTITSVTPNTGLQGTTISATINGTNLAGANAVTFSGTGVTATVQGGGTSSSVPVTITIAPGTIIGLRTLTVTTPIGSAFGGFTVTGPTITSISPSMGLMGTSFSATIAGTNLSGATAVDFSGTGVTATIGRGGTSTSLPVDITIAPGIATGIRTLTVTTPNGIGPPYSGFTVTGPVISGLNQSSADPATSFAATISGSNLSNATAVNFSGSGVTATIGNGGTSTTVPVTVTITPDAAASTRTITVTTTAGTSPAFSGLTVRGPTISSLSPSIGDTGSTFAATLTGTNLLAATAVNFSGQGVTATIGNGPTKTSLPLLITIAPQAAVGLRTLTVTTLSGTSAAYAGLTVRGPTITGLTPSSGIAGTSLAATITGVNLVGATGVNFSGTGVTATVGVGGTASTLPITIQIAPDVRAETRTLSVTTPNGTSASFTGFTVIPGVTGISPSFGMQGTVFSAVISGSNLSGATAVTLNKGVRAIIDPGGTDRSLPVTFTVANDALVGPVGLAVSTAAGTSPVFLAFNVVASGMITKEFDLTNIPRSGAFVTGMAADKHGDLFVVDRNEAQVLKISVAGVITRVAGGNGMTIGGGLGFNGDGGLATAATFSSPEGIAVDSAGNLYIADYLNNRVRKVNASGIITTVAGNGTTGFNTGDGGLATSATVPWPFGVAVDGQSNLFISDAYGRIRKVAPTGIITTVAQLVNAKGIAVDKSGTLFVADDYHVRKVSSDGSVTIVAGSGQPSCTAFLQNSDSLYCDSFTVGDGGLATSARLSPRWITIADAGDIFVTDAYTRVRKINMSGIIGTVVSGGRPVTPRLDGPATNGNFLSLGGIALNPYGSLFVSDGTYVGKVTFTSPTALPAITAIAPTSAVQGATVSATLTGTGLGGATVLSFDGTGITAAIGSGGTETSLPVMITIAPDATIGARSMTVTTPIGTTSAFSGFNVTAPPARITGLNPALAAIGATFDAVITGTNLSSATVVTFSGSGVTATIRSGGTQATLPVTITIAPNASVGVRTLTVTTPSGRSDPPFSGLTVALSVLVPVINTAVGTQIGLSQTAAPYFGGPFALTINGTDFDVGAVVSLGTINLATTRVSATQLTASVPTGALASVGAKPVAVINPGGLRSNAMNLNVVERGDISANGSVNIGDALVCALTVGGINKPPLANSVGDVNLSGSTNIGDCLTIALFAGRLLANLPGPAVLSVSPSPAIPGSYLTITGTGFSPIVENNFVRIAVSSGDLERVIIPTEATPTQLTVVIPPDAISGSLHVRRTDNSINGGEFPLVVAGTIAPLLLTSVNPSTISSGGELVLRGMGFSSNAADNQIEFSSTAGVIAVPATGSGPGYLTVTVPNGVECGPVRVALGNRKTAAKVLIVTGSSCALELVDIWGAGSPGGITVLEGTGFDTAKPSNNVVKFDNIIAPVLSAGATQLHVRLPEVVTRADVSVFIGSRQSSSLEFRRQDVPSWLPAGILSWWKGERTAVDSVGSNHGGLVGGTTFEAGQVRQAFSFDGVDDLITIPTDPLLEVEHELTIAAWVYATDINDIRTIVAKDGDSAVARSYGLTMGYPQNERASFFVAKTDGTYTQIACSVPLQLNTWQHLAGTYKWIGDGRSQLRLYLNGVSCAEDLSAVGPINISTLPLTIGRYAAPSFGGRLFPWKGKIDEVMFFSRALSGEEVKAMYEAYQAASP